MSHYTTVGELINNLKDCNQDEPIIYQYYLAEHFETDPEKFGKVAEKLESLIPCLDNATLVITDYLKEVSA